MTMSCEFSYYITIFANELLANDDSEIKNNNQLSVYLKNTPSLNKAKIKTLTLFQICNTIHNNKKAEWG